VVRAIVGWLGFVLLGGTLIGLLALGAYMSYLDSVIRTQFEGKRWSLPARVYARPLELFPGMTLSADALADELELLRYRAVPQSDAPGTYTRHGNSFELFVRGFTFWDGTEPARRIKLTFKDKTLAEINSLDNESNTSLVRMEPVEIAGIYPAHAEDRILVKRDELPPVLVDSLIAVEDRTFYEHFGLDPKGIGRALVANLKAGRTVQGGSTLTQQLVKNFFLTNERTWQRKVTEALMALLVDWRYSKEEILEAYSNEVYLGQDGSRAIHGLGLASRFYFDRALAELDLHHIALLVGLVNGPSKYDPRRHPERALERRGLVLDVLLEQGLIGAEDAAVAKALPLDVSPDPPSGVSRYPAFLDLVQRQLQQDYRKEDLTTAGLQIFTSLNPQIQTVAEQAIQRRLPLLEHGRRQKGQLQAAAVVADTQTGEVLALVGGRDVRLAGFNRALDAKRSAGSLLKPAIYLTALELPEQYTLATLLDDTKPVVYSDGSKPWKPQNYDHRFHGRVMLRDALAHSYNVPAARLGLDLDVIQVIDTLQRLGIKQELKPYPSLLLGAVDVAPIEIAQMYETLASGGFRTPLRTIRAVTTVAGETLQRYSVSVEKVVEPGPAYLIINAMQRVVEAGTAQAINSALPKNLGIAGKTGTTDDYRDSWFAGFSGNRLGVIWVGRDDNQPTGLSGANGALPVWIEMMRKLEQEPLDLTPPPEVEIAQIDPRSGLLASKRCGSGLSLPFVTGSAPRSGSGCGSRPAVAKRRSSGSGDTQTAASGSDSIDNFFKRLLE
jgi:penicillin-binding protein 1B